MTSPFTPAEIETLRRTLEHVDARSSAQEALAILDRLSPPAPQVDEATKIAREFVARYHAKAGYPMMVERARKGEYDKDRLVDVDYLRQAIAELIASKDADIERWHNSYEIAFDQAMKNGSELSAMRAENERLKDTIADLGVDLDEWQRCERAAGNIPSPKAAERNPAEPDILSVRAERALGQIPAPDTAPGRNHPMTAEEIVQKLTKAQHLREDLLDNWDALCSGDPPPHPRDGPDFPESLEQEGFVELVPVDGDALAHPFASEIGLEPGGMMWRLTPLGLEVRRLLENTHD